MQQAKLEAQQRNTFGKQSARDLRKEGGVPAVLYGRAQDTLAIQVNARTFKQFLRTYGENVIINMEIGAGAPETVIIKEIQRHPVDKQTLLHADFIRISLDEPVTSAVPVILVGNPPGVQQGGVLESPLREVSLHCLPMQIPNEITIDVGHLEIGDSVHVSDLTLDEEIDILDEPERILAMVSQPRIHLEDELAEDEEGEGAEEDAAEEPTEPEVISRRRDDDDE
ncbi:50S ribosomal protein L25 [Candidatus Poribacteria bacterium]|nr:50S ribosomal protein L25 [Candidatus Poribacteria bacterium]MXV83686.1 50S ribosomal protein L25 [Candidatus Poribacteria bacterium]MYA56286.1 50S ribosomal protein L25 [Candidatus Poribacteria bacterium]